MYTTIKRRRQRRSGSANKTLVSTLELVMNPLKQTQQPMWKGNVLAGRLDSGMTTTTTRCVRYLMMICGVELDKLIIIWARPSDS